MFFFYSKRALKKRQPKAGFRHKAKYYQINWLRARSVKPNFSNKVNRQRGTE